MSRGGSPHRFWVRIDYAVGRQPVDRVKAATAIGRRGDLAATGQPSGIVGGGVGGPPVARVERAGRIVVADPPDGVALILKFAAAVGLR